MGQAAQKRSRGNQFNRHEADADSAGGIHDGLAGNGIGVRGKHSAGEKQHLVRITEPFYLGTYPVTYGDFLTFCHAAEYKTEAETDGKGAYGTDSKDNWSQKPKFTFQ